MFDCVTYINIDSTARSKLDDKSKRYFYTRYGDNEFGYHFWVNRTRKIIRSKDVIFNESVLYKDMLRTYPKDSSPEVKKSEVISFKIF